MHKTTTRLLVAAALVFLLGVAIIQLNPGASANDLGPSSLTRNLFSKNPSNRQPSSYVPKDITLPLWPDPVPYTNSSHPQDKPSLTVHFPSAATHNGTAVLLITGGAYSILDTHSPYYVDTIPWLTSLGTTVITLQYRLGSDGYHYPTQFLEGIRAMHQIHYHANEWQINPNKIVVMGFSAGGHLASLIEDRYDGGYSNLDPIDNVSSKPFAAVLVYPVITMTDPYANKDSRNNLLGNHPDQKTINETSSEKLVNSQTPPTLILTAADDRTVSPENSKMYDRILTKLKVPHQLIIYPKGGHGFALDTGKHSDIAGWLKSIGFFSK